MPRPDLDFGGSARTAPAELLPPRWYCPSGLRRLKVLNHRTAVREIVSALGIRGEKWAGRYKKSRYKTKAQYKDLIKDGVRLFDFAPFHLRSISAEKCPALQFSSQWSGDEFPRPELADHKPLQIKIISKLFWLQSDVPRSGERYCEHLLGVNPRFGGLHPLFDDRDAIQEEHVT